MSRTSSHAGYDAFPRSPGLRRSNSASAIGSRAAGVNNGAPAAGMRSSGFGSAPRRRPYENTSAYATPERDWEYGARAGLGGYAAPGASGHQHRANALELESRLTEKLREHSFSTNDAGLRRPGAGLRTHSAAGQSFHDDSSYGGYPAPPSRFDPRSSQNLAAGRGVPSGLGLDRRAGFDRQLASNTSTPQMEAHHYGRSASVPGQRPSRQEFTPGSGVPTPQLRTDLSMTGLTESGGMPESRLKIYSDLFEEVIERDRVFGSLLRKIKTAYDMLLLRSPAVPPFPMDASSLGHHGH